MDTVSGTDGGQFGDRGFSKEVFYGGSDEEYDFRDDSTQQPGVW